MFTQQLALYTLQGFISPFEISRLPVGEPRHFFTPGRIQVTVRKEYDFSITVRVKLPREAGFEEREFRFTRGVTGYVPEE